MVEKIKLNFLTKYFKPKSETEFFLTQEEKEEYLRVQREDLRKQFESEMASMINLPSLFAEPANDGFLVKWGPTIMSGVTLIAVMLK